MREYTETESSSSSSSSTTKDGKIDYGRYSIHPYVGIAFVY